MLSDSYTPGLQQMHALRSLIKSRFSTSWKHLETQIHSMSVAEVFLKPNLLARIYISAGSCSWMLGVSRGWNENQRRARGQQLVEDMAIIYKNMLSQAHKNKSPKLNSWEGLGVAPRLASSLPDGEVRPRLARQLHLNFRFPLGTEKIAGEGKRKKSNEHDCSVFSPCLIK